MRDVGDTKGTKDARGTFYLRMKGTYGNPLHTVRGIENSPSTVSKEGMFYGLREKVKEIGQKENLSILS